MPDIEETIELIDNVSVSTVNNDNDTTIRNINDNGSKNDNDTILSNNINNNSKSDNSKSDNNKDNIPIKNINDDNKYYNYIFERKKELILDLLKFIGWGSFNDSRYITFNNIQNDRIEKYIISMLDALRTVFKTYDIRSMTRQNKDKRFCLNITRQLLQNIGYTLKMKTYPLIRNNIITSSTKYKIVKKN